MRALKAASVLLIAAFLLSLSATVWLEFNFANRMPQAPDESQGRVHPTQVWHGMRIYVTERELALQDLIQRKLFFGGLCAALAAGALNVRYKLFKPFGLGSND